LAAAIRSQNDLSRAAKPRGFSAQAADAHKYIAEQPDVSSIVATTENCDEGRQLVQKPTIGILPQVVHKSLTKMGRLDDGSEADPLFSAKNCSAQQRQLRKVCRQFGAGCCTARSQ
jgi:hypothetical protein